MALGIDKAFLLFCLFTNFKLVYLVNFSCGTCLRRLYKNHWNVKRNWRGNILNNLDKQKHYYNHTFIKIQCHLKKNTVNITVTVAGRSLTSVNVYVCSLSHQCVLVYTEVLVLKNNIWQSLPSISEENNKVGCVCMWHTVHVPMIICICVSVVYILR